MPREHCPTPDCASSVGTQWLKSPLPHCSPAFHPRLLWNPAGEQPGSWWLPFARNGVHMGFMDKIKDAASQAVDQAKESAQQRIAELNPLDPTTRVKAPVTARGPVPIIQVESHIDGKNALVRLWPDRIEWMRESLGGMNKAAAWATLGASVAVTGRTGTSASDTLLLRHVTSVTTRKDGLRFYAVDVQTSAGAVANTISFRVDKDEATAFRDAVLNAVRDLNAPAAGPTVVVNAAAPVAPAAPAETSVADKVKQLADLHAAGVLTDEEFAAAKAKALGI
ncbi:SHOCT domain-containing protein [Xylanimonas protaetiae]|nr:SHOCT domain-containing protein [Xylanimonas protaetiae]